MLRTARRDTRFRGARQISIALIVAWLLGGCGLRRERDGEAEPANTAIARTPSGRAEVSVGRVSMVDAAGRFVLVDAPYGVQPGTELQLRRGTAPVGRLKAGTERRAGLFAAGIESGTPEVGDEVVMVR